MFDVFYLPKKNCEHFAFKGSKNALNTELSQEELVWATIGRFALEEELQAARWREALLHVEVLILPLLSSII